MQIQTHTDARTRTHAHTHAHSTVTIVQLLYKTQMTCFEFEKSVLWAEPSTITLVSTLKHPHPYACGSLALAFVLRVLICKLKFI